MRKLHARWGDSVDFVTVLVRQGHPGPDVPHYRHYEDKRLDAISHKRDDRIPWPVLIDNLQGSVHNLYGGLADPTFIIDGDGAIAFYNAITHAPTLHRALMALQAQGRRGVAGAGFDRRVHALPVITGGWPAIRRGMPQSVIDLETALPTSALLPFLGSVVRPMLAPITLRATPLPLVARVALAASAGLVAYVTASEWHARSRARDAAA